MIRLTILLKKRALDSDLEKLRCAVEDLKQAILQTVLEIPAAMIKKLRKAGIRGSRAGARLRKIIRRIQ